MNKPKIKTSKTNVGRLVSYLKSHKYLSLLAVALFWWWFIYSPYPKYPIKVPFAVEKAGTVYETDFTAPYLFNLGSRLTEISIGFVDTVPGRLDADLDMRFSEKNTTKRIYTTIEKLVGVYFSEGSSTKEPVMSYGGAEFEVKLILTPHTNVDSPIIFDTGHYNGHRKKALETSKAPLELIAKLVEYGPEASLFSGGRVKILAYADLEMGGNYHLRVESLKNVPIPEGFEIYLWVGQGYSPK